MRWLHNPLRLIRVVGTFFRTGAVEQLLKITKVSKRVKFLILLTGKPLIIFGIKGPFKKSSIVRALIALGPAYIKFGQLLSTRPDIVGTDLANELKVLQDSLEPFSTEEAKKIVNEELGKPVENIFSSFSDSVAAASIAQVHKATVKETNE
ncbi:AarF/UbiB family protein, partial [Paracoccaceae bacterium]|nr:AarF/UbiB family protein [Paracoccaceae bacterium]